MVKSIKGDFSIQPVTATDDPTQVRGIGAVLTCVKMWQLPGAAKAIAPMLDKDTLVIPLENGVEAPAQLAEILGREHVLAGLCQIASRIASPGVIEHSGIEPYIALGELDNHPSERANTFLGVLQHAGINAEIPADITAALWKKFLFISAVSGIGAVTRVPFGVFRSTEGTRQLLIQALNECYAVAIAQGVRLPPEAVNNTLAFIDSLPQGTMASMQRDILSGRPSELEAQNGAIVRMGQKLNVPTPVHTYLYLSLLPQENLAHNSSH